MVMCAVLPIPCLAGTGAKEARDDRLNRHYEEPIRARRQPAFFALIVPVSRPSTASERGSPVNVIYRQIATQKKLAMTDSMQIAMPCFTGIGLKDAAITEAPP